MPNNEENINNALNQITDRIFAQTIREEAITGGIVFQRRRTRPQDLQRGIDPVFEEQTPIAEVNETIEEAVEKVIDIEKLVPLYKSWKGIRDYPYKDCVVTRRGLYFHKDDNINVVIDYVNKYPLYIQDAYQIPIDFLANGKPNFDIKAYTERNNVIPYLVRCFYAFDNSLSEFYTLHELIDDKFYKECLFDGCFYHNDVINHMSKKHTKYRKVNAIKKAKLLSINEQYKYGVKSPSFLITEGKKYSFGVELETICGQIPAYLDKELNYESVHDGSLRDENGNVNGGEYVTGILTGDTGFLQLKKLTSELKKRTKVDKKCGMHTHLGLEDGKTFNKELIVSLYKLALMVENQIFQMMPLSRRNNEYCRPLDKINLNYNLEHFKSTYEFELKINQDYDNIMAFLSSGNLTSDKVNKKYDHPLGHKCGYNHKTARYCWLNLIPTVFNTRRNGVYTIEFRNHPGTTSYLKTKYWLLICMGILWYAENYQKEVLLSNSVDLNGIMMLAYPKKANKIISYIEKRTLKFKDIDEKTSQKIELLDYEEEGLDAIDNLPVNKMSIKDL